MTRVRTVRDVLCFDDVEEVLLASAGSVLEVVLLRKGSVRVRWRIRCGGE